MPLLNIATKISQKKSAKISLHELEQLCQASAYSELVSEINSFIKSGLLRPIGKDTNGMFPPLYSHYRICREKENASSVKAEILRLGPDFNPSGYLSNIPLYNKHRASLRKLCDYVRDKDTELNLSMSKNERAYAIWGNEKQLDDAVCKSMLSFTNWVNKLNYYYTPEPFFDYLCNGSKTKSILILENKDIWFSLRKLFMEHKTACYLYGQWFDGLLFGEGKKINRSNALEDYSKEGLSMPPSFYYWGDLDYEGINIYLKISASPVQLFVPGYIAMLEYGRTQKLTPCRTNQVRPSEVDEFLKHFNNSNALEIKAILESGKYIPQEICSYPRLKAALSVTL